MRRPTGDWHVADPRANRSAQGALHRRDDQTAAPRRTREGSRVQAVSTRKDPAPQRSEGQPGAPPALGRRLAEKGCDLVEIGLWCLDEAHVPDSGEHDEPAAGDFLVENVGRSWSSRAVQLADDDEGR